MEGIVAGIVAIDVILHRKYGYQYYQSGFYHRQNYIFSCCGGWNQSIEIYIACIQWYARPARAFVRNLLRQKGRVMVTSCCGRLYVFPKTASHSVVMSS